MPVHRCLLFVAVVCLIFSFADPADSMLLTGLAPAAVAQEEPDAAAEDTADDPAIAAPEKVNVSEVSDDNSISARLQRILNATQWFDDPRVEVEDGVAFLSGSTDQDRYREWAGQLATRTEDVVAVVNRIQVREPAFWDFDPAWATSRELGRDVVQSLPLIAIGILLSLLIWLALRMTRWIADRTFLPRVKSGLLREVARKLVVIPVLIIGIYLILKMSGLTRLAVTVLGGTGLVGLVVGFAFRDIAENFLASVLISMQNPFRYGDLIQVDGYTGFVQRVNTRGTLLMTLDGNHVQIPNSTIYKGTIVNYTANPNRQFNFKIGIGYGVPVSEAQEIAFRVVNDHPAVLNDPEPQVLVEELGASTVDLKILAWVNAHAHSWVKVRSSVMRLVKRAFEENGFEMPDGQREVIFPQGVPVLNFAATEQQRPVPTDSVPAVPAGEASRRRSLATDHEEEVASPAEGGFDSEAEVIKRQAGASRDPEDGSENLLS